MRENVELPVAELKKYPLNSRKHSKAQIDALVAAVREWGWTIAIRCMMIF